MLALGFSINLLTLFGLVLAIGIVVDDAIVVVENVERNMHVNHLAPKAATIRAMEEVSGPVVAIVLVFAAVFVPAAFLPGTTGQLYKQFRADYRVVGGDLGLRRPDVDAGDVRVSAQAHQPADQRTVRVV
jgi:multidrug efflux pump subunit AcrB